MNFFKNLFRQEELIIGLCGIRRKKEYIKINIPSNYRKTFIQNIDNNYLIL